MTTADAIILVVWTLLAGSALVVAAHRRFNPDDRHDNPYGPAWQRRAGRFRRRYGRTCARCSDPDPAECHVHHLRYPPWGLRRWWPIHLVPDWWLMPLCEPCHVLVPRLPSRFGLTHRQATRRIMTAWQWWRWHGRLVTGMVAGRAGR